MQNLVQTGFFISQQPKIGETEAFTKQDIQDYIEKAKIQRAAFEKEHGILFSEERKKALYD